MHWKSKQAACLAVMILIAAILPTALGMSLGWVALIVLATICYTTIILQYLQHTHHHLPRMWQEATQHFDRSDS